MSRYYFAPVFALLAMGLPATGGQESTSLDLLAVGGGKGQWFSKFSKVQLVPAEAGGAALPELPYDLSGTPGYDWVRVQLREGIDTTPYRFLSFRVWSSGSQVRLVPVFIQRTEQTETNANGEIVATAAIQPVELSFQGWQQFSVPLEVFARIEAIRDNVSTVNFSLMRPRDDVPDLAGSLRLADLRLTIEPAGEVLEQVVPFPPADINIPDDETFFGLLNLDLPALTAVRTAVESRDWPAARLAWARHLTERTDPHWIWSRHDRERIATMLAERGAALEKAVPAAEAVMRREFNWLGVRKVLERNIKWLQGPVEWTHVLSRHGYWTSLGHAWWATGNSAYAEDWVTMLCDWIEDNPVPRFLTNDRGAEGTVWRTLETGIRGDLWFDIMELFMDAPAFDPDAKVLMTRSLLEQARHLQRFETTFRAGNWQVVECTGLAVIGMMLPEFRESAQWRERGFKYLVEHMEKDVFPDGAHHELTPGYHGWVLERFLKVALVAQANGYTVPGLLDRHERMFDFLMHLSRPDRRAFGVGDAGTGSDIRATMGLGALLYGRSDLRYLGPEKAPAGWLWLFAPERLEAYEAIQPEPPGFTSHLLPDAQYGVMRTGWERDDAALLFDAAPWGGGHSHQDRLQVVLYAGRDLLVDPGMYSYDQPLSTGYFRRAKAHNVLLIDEHRQPDSNPRMLSWIETPEVGFCAASIKGGGQRQQRSVLFVKPGYWVVTDHVFGDGDPVLTRLFHFPNIDVEVSEHSVRTRFEQGRNVWLGSPDSSRVERREGWLPTGGSTAERAPVAAFVSKGSLPVGLVTVIIPFDSSTALPRIESFDAGEPLAIGIRLLFPDGQRDTVAISAEPTALQVAGETGTGVVLCRREGPRARSVVLIGEHKLSP